MRRRRLSRADVARIQAQWYQLLEDSGFRDLERRHTSDGHGYTIDLNALPATTMYHGTVSYDSEAARPARREESCGPASDHAGPHLAENLRTFGAPTPIEETPTAIYWRQMSEAVASLPPNYRGRHFLSLWVESGNLLDAARHAGLSRECARGILRRLMTRINTGLGDHQDPDR